MRLYLTVAVLLLSAGLANAESIRLEPGMWRVTTDTYFEISGLPDDMSEPPTSTEITECWATEEETTLDPSLLGDMDGCVLGETTQKSFGLQAALLCSVPGMDTDGQMDFFVSLDRKSLSGQMNLTAWNEDLYASTTAVFFAQRTGECTAD